MPKAHAPAWKNLLWKSTLEVCFVPHDVGKQKTGRPRASPSPSVFAVDYRDSIHD